MRYSLPRRTPEIEEECANGIEYIRDFETDHFAYRFSLQSAHCLCRCHRVGDDAAFAKPEVCEALDDRADGLGS